MTKAELLKWLVDNYILENHIHIEKEEVTEEWEYLLEEPYIASKDLQEFLWKIFNLL